MTGCMCQKLAAPLKHPYQAIKRAAIPLCSVKMPTALQGVCEPHKGDFHARHTYSTRNKACQILMASVIFPKAASESPDLEQ